MANIDGDIQVRQQINGELFPKGAKGDTGNGIDRIVKTSSVGLVDTYTIYFTDGTTKNYEVTNGEKGDQGIQGEQGIQGPQGIQGIQGLPGEAFSIYKTYSSIAAMNADKANVPEGKFVLITSNVEDPDNAKLYVKGATDFTYLTDMSGATGIQGPQGEQGIQGVQGEKGPKGDPGDVSTEQMNTAIKNATKGYQETEFLQDIEIRDSAGVNGKIKLVGGNTEQESYSTDYNFFDGNTEVGTFNQDGTINSANTNGKYTPNYIKVVPNIKINTSANINRVVFYDINKNFIERSSYNNINEFTIISNAYYIRFDMLATVDTSTLTLTLEEPSPNPDYPQKVNNVGSNVNLFDKSDTPINNVNVTKTEINTGVRITLTSALAMRASYMPIKNINTLLGKTLTLSAKITPSGNNIGQIYIFWVNKNTKAVVGSNLGGLSSSGSLTFAVPNEIPSGATDLCILFYGNGNQTTGINVGDYVDYTEVKLEEGSIASGYTAYNRGGIDVKVENKNLVDTSSFKSGYIGPDGNFVSTTSNATFNYDNPIKVKPSSKYYFSANTSCEGLVAVEYDINKKFITRQAINRITGGTITTSNNTYYVILFVNYNGQTLTQTIIDGLQLQFELGESRSSYIAHQEQNITIPLPTGMELCKKGNYSDKTFHNIPSNPMYNASLIEGGWYKYNAIYEKIVDENDNLTLVASNSNENFIQINMNTNIPVPIPVESYSDYFSYLPTVSSATVDKTQAGFCLRNQSLPYIVFSVPAAISTSANVFKTWLTTHNVKIKYPLATPTYTQITDTDTLEALYKIEHLLMYKEYTHIYTDDEVQAYLQLDYLYDNEVNNTFGSIIDALEERVHSLESGVSA